MMTAAEKKQAIRTSDISYTRVANPNSPHGYFYECWFRTRRAADFALSLGHGSWQLRPPQFDRMIAEARELGFKVVDLDAPKAPTPTTPTGRTLNVPIDTKRHPHHHPILQESENGYYPDPPFSED